MNTRTTIVQMESGGPWIHSPIEIAQTVEEFLTDREAPVVALIASNKAHHMYMMSRRSRFPDATMFAYDDLKKKLSSVANIESLRYTAPEAYASDVEQVLFESTPCSAKWCSFMNRAEPLYLQTLFRVWM